MIENRRKFFSGLAKAGLAGAAMAATTLSSAVETTPQKRGLLHIAIGDENWQASPEEMQKMVDLFNELDLDPKGGIIATDHRVRVTRI